MTGASLASAPHRAPRASACMRRCSALEARLAVGVEGDDLAVEHRAVRAQRAVQPRRAPDSAAVMSLPVAGHEAHPARLAEGDRAHAVPLDLEAPSCSSSRAAAGRRAPASARAGRASAPGRDSPSAAGPSGGSSSPWRLVRRSGRARSGPVTRSPCSVDLDLACGSPLEDLVGAAVPDRHRPGAVGALRDLAVELEVLERMVLGVDGDAVVLGAPTAGRWAAPRRRARRRARGAGPSAGASRGAPGSRSAAAARRRCRSSPPAGSGVAAKSRLAAYSSRRWAIADRATRRRCAARSREARRSARPSRRRRPHRRDGPRHRRADDR